MKPHCKIAGALFLAGLTLSALTPSRVAAQAEASKSNTPRAAESPDLESKRAETYYNYTMGHIAEQMLWIPLPRLSVSVWRRCIGRRSA